MAIKVKGGRRRRTRVSRKNQITLPVAVLSAARVRPGDELQVEATGEGKILLTRAYDPLDDFVGAIPGLSAAADLDRLRAEWER